MEILEINFVNDICILITVKSFGAHFSFLLKQNICEKPLHLNQKEFNTNFKNFNLKKILKCH
jgi:hypothetical protein